MLPPSSQLHWYLFGPHIESCSEKFNSLNQLQIFYRLNLRWNNEGTGLLKYLQAHILDIVLQQCIGLPLCCQESFHTWKNIYESVVRCFTTYKRARHTETSTQFQDYTSTYSEWRRSAEGFGRFVPNAKRRCRLYSTVCSTEMAARQKTAACWWFNWTWQLSVMTA